MKKNFIDSYGYAPTLYKNDIILKDILEVKPVKPLRGDLSLPIPIYGGGGAKSKKSFDYGYAPTLYKNDIVLNDYLPEVKPVRGIFVDDFISPIQPPIETPIYTPPFIDVMPPPPVEKPIEQPIQQPIEQPIASPKFFNPIFLDDMPPPVEPIIELPKDWYVLPVQQPIEKPVEQPIQNTASTLPISENSNVTIKSVEKAVNTAINSSSDKGFSDDSKSLPIKEVSKNLKPYIYAGLGIVAILIVSRMLIKKN
jgi:hypothetical protein